MRAREKEMALRRRAEKVSGKLRKEQERKEN